MCTHVGEWTSPNVTGKIPSHRAFFSFTKYDDQHAVLFGGYRAKNKRSNEAYVLDMEKMVNSGHGGIFILAAQEADMTCDNKFLHLNGHIKSGKVLVHSWTAPFLFQRLPNKTLSI